jgi:hypothetical protein
VKTRMVSEIKIFFFFILFSSTEQRQTSFFPLPPGMRPRGVLTCLAQRRNIELGPHRNALGSVLIFISAYLASPTKTL